MITAIFRSRRQPELRRSAEAANLFSVSDASAKSSWSLCTKLHQMQDQRLAKPNQTPKKDFDKKCHPQRSLARHFAPNAVKGSAFLLLALAVAFALPVQAQWEIEESHTTASLRGIVNVGGGVAWASGTNGTVLRTEDGGYLWQTCSIPLAGTKDSAEKLDFRGIQAFDENTAVVMSSGPGDQSRLYKTTDGCQTWKLLFTNPDKDGFWDAVRFTNAAFGKILGDPVKGQFQMWSTLDGGTNWQSDLQAGLKADPTQGAFAASNSSLAPILVGNLWSFGSGGKAGAFVYANEETITICNDGCPPGPFKHQMEWAKASVPITSGTESAGIFSLVVKKGSSVAVGGDYLKPDEYLGTAAYSVDFARTWFAAKTPPHGYRSAVAYDSTTKTWITVGPNGTDISADDGRNWRPLTPAPQDDKEADKNWNALSLPFVVGPRGRIGKLRTTAVTPAALPSANATPAKAKP